MTTTGKKNDNSDLTGEILSSERIGGFMSFAHGFQPGVAFPDNPTWVWEQLRFNPWLAMAVYDDIEEKDDQVGYCLDTRKENVLSKSRHVRAASDKRSDKKIADFVQETLEEYLNPAGDGERLGFDHVLWEALDCIGKGLVVGEKIYGEANDRIFLQDVRFKPQHLFSFGTGMMAGYSTSAYPFPQTGPLRLRPGVIAEGLSSETPLPAKKFFVHSYRPRHGNRWGSPLIRKIFWLSWLKRANVKNWLRYGEKGAGTVAARYNDGAAQAEQQMALDAARAVFEESVVALPKKFLIEVMESVRTSMGSNFKEFADDYCNAGIARVILGQTLTSRGSDGGGSRSLGEVHERKEERKTEVDARSLMLAVNTQLVFPLVIANHGYVQQPPLWAINYAPGADLDTLSQILERLWKMGLPISRNYVYNTFQVGAPGEDEEVLPTPSTIVAPPDAVDEEDKEAGGFAEKKSHPGASSEKRPTQPGLKKERFARLRPTTMPRSGR
jgi:phage gp29-like protein